MIRFWLCALLTVAHVVAWPARVDAQRYEPDLRFETIDTPHFWIHFHQGERPLAERVAGFAEEIRGRVAAAFSRVPTGRIHVILSGQDDMPNGWATPFPFNVIELRTTWPRPSAGIGNTDDWLRLVFAHEYTHIVHLDRSRGLMSAVRYVFGRAPFAMPNLFLPAWQVEGIATWQESMTTGHGRVQDGMTRRVPRAAARTNAFDGIDRVSGGLTSWPGGDGPYAYGGLFHDYLSDRFGAQSLERLADATAAWPPYLGFFAFGGTFNASLGSTWKAFEAVAAGTGDAASAAAGARRLTHDGFKPGAPRWDSGTADTLYFTQVTPHAFPALVKIDAGTGVSTRVAWRYLGDGLAARRGRVLFDQFDLSQSVALQTDLYVLSSGSGPIRLTTGARAGDPDLSTDGNSIAFVVSEGDRRALSVARLPVGDLSDQSLETTDFTILASEAGTYFSSPRWSPDGRSIAAERVRPGQLADVVVVDVAGRQVVPLAPGIGARQATPAWTPDGAFVVMAVADAGDPFSLVAVSVSDRRVWSIPTRGDGVRFPDVAPDGSRIAFLGYTTDGEDVFIAPFDRATWRERSGSPAVASDVPASPASQAPVEVATPRPYSPLHVLVPRYWSPVLAATDGAWQVGAATSSVDALGRHAWSASAWRRSDTAQLDWRADYTYARMRPTLFAAASAEYRTFGSLQEVTRAASVGAALPFARVRRVQQVLGALRYERATFDAGGESRSLNRHALRLGWALSTARTFGYSISREEGAEVGITSEHVLPALGADGQANAVVAQGRYYIRLGGRHAVVAVRAAGAASGGDPLVRRQFTEACSNVAGGLFDIDREAIALMRGVETSCRAATRAAVLNLDYRVPLWRVERGAGSLPGFLRWMHGAVFTDLGDSWDSGSRPRWRVSSGAELSADVVLGYTLPLTITGGVAWVRDQDGIEARGPRGYIRVGRAF